MNEEDSNKKPRRVTARFGYGFPGYGPWKTGLSSVTYLHSYDIIPIS